METPWTDLLDGCLIVLYSEESNSWLADHFGCSVSAIKNRANKLGLTKEGGEQTLGRFLPGHKPWNKGKSCPSSGRSMETQFKPGQKPKNWVPVGSIRLTKDGFIQRKVTDTGYPPNDWRSEHVLIWEQHQGQHVPKGHIVRFRDGDRRNFDPENLVLVSHGENLVINRHLAQGGGFIEGELDILILLARIKMMQAHKIKRETTR